MVRVCCCAGNCDEGDICTQCGTDPDGVPHSIQVTIAGVTMCGCIPWTFVGTTGGPASTDAHTNGINGTYCCEFTSEVGGVCDWSSTGGSLTYDITIYTGAPYNDTCDAGTDTHNAGFGASLFVTLDGSDWSIDVTDDTSPTGVVNIPIFTSLFTGSTSKTTNQCNDEIVIANDNVTCSYRTNDPAGDTTMIGATGGTATIVPCAC